MKDRRKRPPGRRLRGPNVSWERSSGPKLPEKHSKLGCVLGKSMGSETALRKGNCKKEACFLQHAVWSRRRRLTEETEEAKPLGPCLPWERFYSVTNRNHGRGGWGHGYAL